MIKYLLKVQLIVFMLITINTINAKAQKGALYENFPESFESSGEQKGMAKKMVNLSSGKWEFNGVSIDSFVVNDRPTSGSFALRMAANNIEPLYAQMNFDLMQGASKVTVWFSSYGAKADKKGTFKLEYSTDKGKNWIQSGKDVVVNSKTKHGLSFPLNISGNVRFRIVKLPLGDGKDDPTIENGRLSFDDFSVYKN